MTKTKAGSPEHIARVSAAARKSWVDPEVRARRIAAIRAGMEAKRADMSSIAKQSWADPERRPRRRAR